MDADAQTKPTHLGSEPVYIHCHHLVLLGSKADTDTHFTVPCWVKGRVDQSITVRMCSLCSGFETNTQIVCGGRWSWDPLSGMLPAPSGIITECWEDFILVEVQRWTAYWQFSTNHWLLNCIFTDTNVLHSDFMSRCLQQIGVCVCAFHFVKRWLLRTSAELQTDPSKAKKAILEFFNAKLMVFGHILRSGNWVVFTWEKEQTVRRRFKNPELDHCDLQTITLLWNVRESAVWVIVAQSDRGTRTWHSTWRGPPPWPWPWLLDTVSS